VIGVGGMGSAALYHLARSGIKVLGLEQFHIGHDRGSSHGQTRIIRKAYFEHPAYVPLLQRAYELWRDLETECDEELFHQTGLLLVGPPDGFIIPGVQRSAREHQLDIQTLTVAEARKRFNGFVINDDQSVLFEPDAGFLRVEACVHAHVDRAVAHGATILAGTAVKSWSVKQGAVEVSTESGTHSAATLLICGGPWAGQLLSELRLPLEVRRKVVFWFDTTDDSYDLGRGCLVFGFETADGFVYGFPVIDSDGIKVAHHSGGERVERADELDRTLHPEDTIVVRRFIDKHLPRVGDRLNRYSVCMYTMTPDEHFIVDRHPAHPNVIFAAGFSGHGFKFAPIIGSILADLTIDDRTAEPIAFLSASRPALAGK